MNRLRYIAILCVISTLSFSAKGQEHIEFQKEIKSESVGIQQADSLIRQFNSISQQITSGQDSAYKNTSLVLDTFVDIKISKLRQFLEHRVDSLKSTGNASAADLEIKLDSLDLNIIPPGEKYQRLSAIDQKIKDQIKEKVPGFDSLYVVRNNAKRKINDVQSVSIELGLGPLGKDLNPMLNMPLQDTNIPGLPSDLNRALEVSNVNKLDAVNTDLPTQKIPGNDLKLSFARLPDEVVHVQNQTGKISDVANQAGDVAQNAGEYTKEIKTIKEEGLTKTEKLPELAEQQATQLEEVKALQTQQAETTKQLEEHKKLIAQYKEEKRIHEELKEKTKELATEKITQNQSKVDDAMKKIGKYKRKFSQVHDMRNLPKRAPNPMKGVSWRERVVPGLTFQTFTGDDTWLEFDPQVYYKLNGNLSAGIGGMYRFSLNPSKFTFDDFGSMTGAKIFAQYHIMKGFFARGELLYVRWKPWDLKLTDPYYVDHTFVAAAGIGKGYQIAKKIKGNIQTLYHFHWEGMDPYKPKIMIRIGVDFSLMKREEKHWEKKLKEVKQGLKEIN